MKTFLKACLILVLSAAPALASGIFVPFALPPPSPGELGGVFSDTCGAHEWFNEVDTSGNFDCARPAASDVSGLAASATIDTTNASNITSGTLPPAQLPMPTVSSPGGVEAVNCAAHQWLNTIPSTSISPSCAQPGASDVSGLAASATTDTTNAANITSGTLPNARLPTPTVSALGGVEAVACAAHQWLNTIPSTSTSPSCAQPGASDVSGLAASATTDTTNATNITSGTLPNARLANIPNSALALLGNLGQSILLLDNYGTAHDGITDDTGAVQAALNACLTYGGGQVLAGPYRYLLSSANVNVWGGCLLGGPPGFNPFDSQNERSFAGVMFTLLLSPPYTIDVASGGALEDLSLIASNWVAPTSARTALTGVANFAGTAITAVGGDATVKNVMEVGFANCYNESGYRIVLKDVNCDQSGSGDYAISITNDGNLSPIEDVHVEPFSTKGYGLYSFSVSSPVNNAGAVQLTVGTNPSLTLITGDTVWVTGVPGVYSANGRWPITVSGSNITLVGSYFTPPTFTGTAAANNATISGVSSFNGLAVGQTLSGAYIPTGAVIAALDPHTGAVIMGTSAPDGAPAYATGSGSTTVTPSNSAYSSGGTVNVDAGQRLGEAFYFGNDTGIHGSGLMGFAHQTGFHVDATTTAFLCSGCRVDSDGQLDDPTSIGVEFTGTGTSGNIFSGCKITAVGTDVLFDAANNAEQSNQMIGCALGANNNNYSTLLDFEAGVGSVNSITDFTEGNIFVSPSVQRATFSASFLYKNYLYDESLAAAQNTVFDQGTSYLLAGNLYQPVAPNTPAAGSWVLNGDMRIDQMNEGNALTSACGSGANGQLDIDAWACKATSVGSEVVKSQQISSDAVGAATCSSAYQSEPCYQNALKYTVTTAATVSSSTVNVVQTRLDATNFQGMGWGASGALPVELSFFAKASVAGSYCGALNNAGGAASYVFPAALATSWTSFDMVIPGPIIGSWATNPTSSGPVLAFDLGSGSTSQATNVGDWESSLHYTCSGATQINQHSGATYEITGVHIRPFGTTGTPYIPVAYNQELGLAYRRFRKSFPPGTVPADNAGTAGAVCINNPIASGYPGAFVPFDEQMQATPTVNTFNPSAVNPNWRDTTSGGDVAATTNNASTTGVQLGVSSAVTAANDSLCIQYDASVGY